MLEIASSYALEGQLLEIQFKEQGGTDLQALHSKISELTAKEVAFEKLYLEVNPTIIELKMVDVNFYTRKFRHVEHPDKDKIYDKLSQKWRVERRQLGTPTEIEIKVSERVVNALNIDVNVCF